MAVGLGSLWSVSSQAATITFNLDVVFSDGAVAPDGPAPWATATFDDGGGSGLVMLTMTVAPTVGIADIEAFYFNLNPTLNPTLLSFTRVSGTGPTAATTVISTGVDAFRPDGDGYFDILFDFPPPPGNDAARFNAGETLVYAITGIGSLTASSFNFGSAPGPSADSPGPFLAAAKALSTGPGGGNSAWLGDSPGGGSTVPLPAAAWLFAPLLAGLGLVRRRVAS